MNDLIRREDVIKLVNQFVFGLCKEQNDEVRRTFNKYIEKMPTAYSVDKVIKELEKLKSNVNSGGTLQSIYADKKIDKAIEIVKHENISDDVCECKKHRVIDNIQMYSTSCLHELEVRCIRKYKYCSYCGKRIKVME